MRIETINNLADFDRVAPRWQALFALDPEAHVFVCPRWLRDWYEVTPYRWQVLAARGRDDGDYLGFCPLAPTRLSRFGVGLHSVLYLGGKPLADYTGFVCHPEHTGVVVRAFGAHIRERMSWDRFRPLHVMHSGYRAFFDALADPHARCREDAGTPCPRIELPATWDTYVNEVLSSNARSNLRRGLRRIEGLRGFRATLAACDDSLEHIDALLRMWQQRWGALSSCDADRYRWMYRLAIEDGRLWLRMLWDGSTPVAGVAAFLEPVHRAFCYHVSGFNPDYQKYSPGRNVLSYCIRDAIENHYRVFDFLLGGEAYKREFFGATDRFAHSLTVDRRGLRHRVRRKLAHWLIPPPVAANRADPGQVAT